MAVVFAVLAILAISIKLFDKADSAIPDDATPEMAFRWLGKKIRLVSDDKPAESVTASASETKAALSEPAAVDDDALTAAAIAVALALAERDNSSVSVPARAMSASTSGSWSASGRARQMSNLMPRPAARRSR